MMGWLAGLLFTVLCRRASNATSAAARKDNFWILIWSSITVCVRILDVLMLLGAVRLDAIYVTPEGPVLYANIVSEIVIACPYTLLALAGSAMLLYAPEDEGEMKEPLTECGFRPSSSEII